MNGLERKLNSVGKESFINFYFKYKNCDNKEKLANELLKSNPAASTIGGQYTRISCARWIFDNGLEFEALDIIKKSKIANGIILAKIREILIKENR